MLFREKQEIYLPPKAVETLLALVERCGEIVHKDELMEVIWTDSIVEESNLSQYLHILRKTLGKKADGKPFIETLRRRGYRFTADVKETALSENRQTPTSKPTNAFEAYQQWHIYYFQNTVPGLIQSRAFLEEAFRFDENYAPAYAALAEQCLMEAVYGLFPLAESFANAKDALRRAFEIEESSAEIYAAAGLVDLICDWNFIGAERNLQKSIELNPHYALANNYLGQVFMFQCRFDLAIEYLQRASNIEPIGLYNRSVLLIAYFLARKYQKLIEESEKIIALDPDWLVAPTVRCYALEQTGRADEAVNVYEKLMNNPGGEFLIRWSGHAYALVGDEKNARKTAALLVAESRQHFVSPLHLAALYTALDEPDTACSHLENALAMRDPWLLWIAADPRFDNLRADPRFQKIEKLVMFKSRQSTVRNCDNIKRTQALNVN